MLNLLLIAMAISPWSEASLNIEHGGQSMGALFKEVSKQTKSTWRVAAEFEPIIITVRLDDVPEAVFREKLAATMDGRWKRLEDGWRLEPDPKKVAETRKKNFDRRVAAIKELQKTSREQIKKFETWNDEREDSLIAAVRIHANNIAENKLPGQSSRALLGLQSEIPVSEIAHRVMASLSAEEFAKVGEIRRVVFSTNPTSRQRPLPPTIAKRIEISLEAQRQFSERIRASIVPKGPAAGYVYALFKSSEPTEVDHVLVVVSCQQWARDSLSFEVLGIDRNGRQLWEFYNAFHMQLANSGVLPEPFYSAAELVPLETLTAQLQKFVRTDSVETVPNEFVATIESFDSTDPIKSMVGDWLVSWADSRDKSALAILPDYVFPTAITFFANNMKASSRFSALASKDSIEWNSEEKWIFGRSRDPDVASRVFTPRRALDRFMRANRLGAKLSDWIEMVGALEPPSVDKTIFYEVTQYDPDLSYLLANENWEALKLLHLIGPAQTAGLVEGRPIALSDLNPQAKKWLELAICNMDFYLRPSSDLRIAESGFVISGEHPRIHIEPTSWPTSTFGTGSLSVTSERFNGVFLALGESRFSYFWPPSAIGKKLADGEKNGATWPSEIGRFEPGGRSNFNFEIRFANGVSGYWTNTIYRRTKGGAVASLDLLPQDIRDAIEKERQKHLKPPPRR